MIINVERRTYKELNEFTDKEEIHYIYNVISHKGGCNKLVHMFERGVISIQNFNHIKDNLFDPIPMAEYEKKEREDALGIYLVDTTMVDNGDYTFDGEDEVYEPYYEEEFSYIEISNCPFCKENIKFTIYDKGDVTPLLDKLIDEYTALCKKKTKSAQRERADLYKKIVDFKSNDLIFK